MSRFRTITHYLNVLVLLYRTLGQTVAAFQQGGAALVGNIIKQIYHTAWKGFGSIVFLGIAIGGVFSLLMEILPELPLPSLFSANIQSGISVLLVVKLVGPLVVMLVVIARSGTAICIELGYMKINNEVDALTTMGISPVHFVLLPRVLGMVISIVVLNFNFIFSALFGGMLVANLKSGVDMLRFLEETVNILQYEDLGYALLYMLGFGLLIGASACYHGMSVKGAFTEIPSLTTQTVVRSIILCLIYYGYITALALESGAWFGV